MKIIKSIFMAACLLATSLSNAAIIENGYMGADTGGYCSSCSDLDSINYSVFDDLMVGSNSIFNSIEFDIVNYTNEFGVLADDTDFLIQLWDTSHSSVLYGWNFQAIDLTSYFLLGERTYTINYDLGDTAVAAGQYLITIAMDFGAFSSRTDLYTAGADGDSVATQWRYSTSSILNNLRGDLPFRLTLTEARGVPEPASFAIFGLALAGLAMVRRRKIK